MVKGALKWIVYSISAVLICFGVLFMIASYADAMRFAVGLVFISLAIIIVYFSREKKPIEIRRTLDLSGATKIREIKCKYCSATLNPDTIRVVDGKPYIQCDYCGNKFELTEEPKW